MAREEVEYPSGVGQAEFDAHAHNYRKLKQLGVDAHKAYSGPNKVDILDDQEVFAQDGTDLEAVGLTVATEPTSTPV